MKGFIQKFSVLALTVFTLSAASADAAKITARGGLALPSGDAYQGAKDTNLYLGGELTFGLSNIFELGAFYDYTNLSPEADTNIDLNSSFYGALVRVGLGPVSNFYVDGKVGLSKLSVNDESSDTALGLGAGLGYRFDIGPLLSISPRVGYRYLPVKNGDVSTDGSMIDISVGVSAGF